ncbi:AsmA family protein [Roseomonas sp. SSH11]|uniref:AsmA family protein n=1 Tax=Pararoseomonas baculiformis TaxID=2820812 RepID=A0ABS4AAQ0_9PROT|nr:AsmA family protein [Pararoseomonas baculiformis]MBP0444072.1 AsmA family protein [Pararoseomonas baculiformis]
MAARRIPRWAIWTGLPLAAIGLLIALWSWDWFIPLAESRASAALGRPVSIEHLHVRLGRVTEISADGVRIANPEGFEQDPPFARAERLTARLDVMAYWHDRAVVIPAIEVTRPVVEAIAREDGRTNYTFDLGQPAGEGAEPPPSSAAPRIGLLRIVEGQAHVVDPRLKADFNLAVATRDEEGAEPRIAVEARGTYAGQPISGTALGGAILALREEGKPWPIEMQIANGPTRASLRGTLQNPLELQGADVRLDLSGPDMGLLQPLTGVPVPKTPAYEIGGQLDYVAGRVRFRDFEGRMGRSDLSGTIAVTTGGEKPEVEAELRSRRVDLADLGGFIGEEPGRASTPGQSPQQRREQARNQARSRVLPDDPINFPKLEAANVSLNYQADSIVGRNMPFDNMRAVMEVKEGAVTLRPLALGVGSGKIEGNIVLTPREEERLHARADLRLQRLDLSRLMQATNTFEGAGRINGRARIEGTGKSFADILGSGTGDLTLGMSGGNLSALLVDLSGLRLGNALLSALGVPGRTTVQCFVGSVALQRGVAQLRTVILDTEDVIINATGNVNLARERLEIRLRSESKSFTIGAVPTSILVDGSFRNPDVGPEMGELAARGGIIGGLAALVAPVAGLLPTIQFGTGEDGRCEALIGRGRARR